MRDVLGLSQAPLGIWALLGLGACIFMFARGNILPCVLLIGVFLLLFFSFYTVNIPSIRYSYLALLLYFVSMAIAASTPRLNISQ